MGYTGDPNRLGVEDPTDYPSASIQVGIHYSLNTLR